MINRTKLAVIFAVVMAPLAATSALAQSFDPDAGTGNVLPISSQPAPGTMGAHHAMAHAARRNGMNSYAMDPPAQSGGPYAMDPPARTDLYSDNPAATGGGSIGYNENLRNDY